MTGAARIGVDARAADAVPTGLTTYAHELIRAMVRLDTRNEFVIIRRPDAGPSFVSGPNVTEVLLRGDASTPTAGGAVSRLGLDLYHSLHHFLPFGVRAGRIVVTLHDLIWVEHPDLIREGRLAPLTRPITSAYAKAAIGYALRRAEHIIAISAASRDRAVERFGIARDKFTVVHHGVDHQRFLPSTQQPVPGAQPPYFLCLGNTKPYKNIPTAVRAFAAFAATQPDTRLVITGRGDALGPLQALATSLGIADRVSFAGLSDDGEMRRLLRGTIALVFPSFVEGFGLPVVEAMASGTPVIASDCPTLREVAAAAALYCDPHDQAAFARAMVRLASEPVLRESLRRAGLDRAAQFQWDRCARETLGVYAALLQQRSAAMVS